MELSAHLGQPFSLIFLASEMAGDASENLLWKANADPALATSRVIVVGGPAGDRDKITFGSVRHVPEPVSASTLLEAILEALSLMEPNSAPPVPTIKADTDCGLRILLAEDVAENQLLVTILLKLSRAQLGDKGPAVLKLGSLGESSKSLTTKENRREETVSHS